MVAVRKCPPAPVSASSPRHGCTASALRAIITLSVIEPQHSVQRNFRSFSGTSAIRLQIGVQ
jgi:hypothetical protein